MEKGVAGQGVRVAKQGENDIQAGAGAVREAVLSARVAAVQAVVLRGWVAVVMGWEAAEMEAVAAVKVWAEVMTEWEATEVEAVALEAAVGESTPLRINLDTRLAPSCSCTVPCPNARCSGRPAACNRPREEKAVGLAVVAARVAAVAAAVALVKEQRVAAWVLVTRVALPVRVVDVRVAEAAVVTVVANSRTPSKTRRFRGRNLRRSESGTISSCRSPARL